MLYSLLLITTLLGSSTAHLWGPEDGVKAVRISQGADDTKTSTVRASVYDPSACSKYLNQ